MEAGSIEIGSLDASKTYAVRSSAANEDSVTATSAGKYDTMLNVKRDALKDAISAVGSGFAQGKVIVQEDITALMKYSGVVYTNINGTLHISMGPNDAVHRIVKGLPAEITININDSVEVKGEIEGSVINLIKEQSINAEKYFGRPLDIEFAITDEGFVFLQARPLPALTDLALKEAEIRRVRALLSNSLGLGARDIPLGVGNYREIMADLNATELSISTFNYIFSGDGKSVLGAVQLGRNELGYENGYEVFPWVLSLGGKVYYNFVADAMQFRPAGVQIADYVKVINNFYIPEVRKDQSKLNYPELGLYVQFPDGAKAVGIDAEPFERLNERVRQEIRSIKVPETPPKRRVVEEIQDIDACISEIRRCADSIRTGSAKEYVKAARLAFFAMEDVREGLERLRAKDPTAYDELSKQFGAKDPEKLRNAIVYDESIKSFELEAVEDNRYMGSFELSMERDFPPKRSYKQGRQIGDAEIAELVRHARVSLENREKVKFYLFRDYDTLRQLYLMLARLSSLGDGIFKLYYEELEKAKEPLLAEYRILLRKDIAKKRKTLFPDPVFMSEIRNAGQGKRSLKSEIIFGSIDEGEHSYANGTEALLLSDVDQTKSLGKGTKLVIVQDNIRPGSHIFTQLSDYGLPVIAVDNAQFERISKMESIKIRKTGDSVEFVYN
ncbi:MAG: PEP/pyruvate-binding domain-containing protein [Candidatus Micrarchaeaceae archaeon]